MTTASDLQVSVSSIAMFAHKKIHKATWISPDDKIENQIDHFCISRKFRRSLEDVRAVRGADVGTDHHMVLGKFRLHLKRHRNFIREKGRSFRLVFSKEIRKMNLYWNSRTDFRLYRTSQRTQILKPNGGQ